MNYIILCNRKKNGGAVGDIGIREEADERNRTRESGQTWKNEMLSIRAVCTTSIIK